MMEGRRPWSDWLIWGLVVSGILGLIIEWQPEFIEPDNVFIVIYYTSIVFPAVLGMYFLILVGFFDLSIGAIAALSGVAYALAVVGGLSSITSLCLGIGVGCLAGFANALLVATLRISPLMITIITMYAARGLAVLLTSGRVVGGIPALDSGRQIANVPGRMIGAVVISLTLVVLTEVLSKRHVFVRRFYQIGDNISAAASSGIAVVRYQIYAFIFAGLGASLVGIIQADRTFSASPLAFPDLALDAISACVLGGMRLSGGVGSPLGCLLGAFIIAASRNLVDLAGMGVYWQDIAIAVVLVVVVLLRRGKRIGLRLGQIERFS